jgi:Right handed beta helix region
MMKGTMRPLKTLALGVFLSGSAHATVYYVAPNGNDANNGTSSSTPWRTIARVNQSTYALQPGDQILFKSGGTYRGQLIVGSDGTSSQPIRVGAYGSGDAPILSGSELVTNWTVHQGNIWKANAPAGMKHLYVNGALQTIARYPNTGWLRNDQGGPTSIYDNALSQANGYWNGAEVVVRSSNWSYDVATITNYTSKTLTFPTIYYDLTTYDWGYFLRNKLSELDMAGEYYFDPISGQVYLWAPANANPNTLTIEASAHDIGCAVFYPYVVVEDLAFKHYRVVGLRLDNVHHCIVRSCTFSDLFAAIGTYGNSNLLEANTITRTYGNAVMILDDNTTFQDNVMTDISMVPGLGESNWGYIGVRAYGMGNKVLRNTLNTIGYIGINVYDDALVENNYVENALALLNDGCAIGFDESDGCIIRDNIIVGVQGNLESSAPNSPVYHPFAHGIYSGNLSVRYTSVINNTVADCRGSGLHLDHTMLSEGNVVSDNVFFNNETQISISDFSNNWGPGAVAPYYVPQYEQTFSGNVFFSLRADQLCMLQYHVYSPQWTDFGDYSNNYYYNPYEEQSILVHNIMGGKFYRYTLARWKHDRQEDLNSSASPRQLPSYKVIGYQSENLVNNGDFANNVAGWDGWPTNAQVTHDFTYLDNGALKAYLPNADMYPEFGLRNPVTFPLSSEQWYEMKFSIQSDVFGEVKTGLKGNSQLTLPDMVAGKYFPFEPSRKNVTYYFPSTITDQAVCQWTNQYTEPRYWLDNVSVRRVQVQAKDPAQLHQLLYNRFLEPQTFALAPGCWAEVNGTLHTGSVTLEPFESVALTLQEEDVDCAMATDVEEEVVIEPQSTFTIFPNPVEAGASLRLGAVTSAAIQYVLVDVQGRTVANGQLAQGARELPVPASVAPGAYSLRVQDGLRTMQARVVVR